MQQYRNLALIIQNKIPISINGRSNSSKRHINNSTRRVAYEVYQVKIRSRMVKRTKKITTLKSSENQKADDLSVYRPKLIHSFNAKYH
jgi:hypothetical protein